MPVKPPPIYLLPGMAYDYPVFSRLTPLLENATVVSFIKPHSDESLTTYAARMADQFPSDCYIGGVSFGGILAIELSRIVRPKGCFIISSVRSPEQLPPRFRVWRFLGARNCSRALRLAGSASRLIPEPMRTSSTLRAQKKLSGTQGEWYRWATSAVLRWQRPPSVDDVPLLQIHGDADQTFPLKYVRPDVVVPSGGHTLPVSHPVEVANAIHQFTQDKENDPQRA